MEVTNVRFYKNKHIRESKGELSQCVITFDNGMIINDLLLVKNFQGKLYVKPPQRTRVNTDGEKRIYSIVFFSSEVYQHIKEVVIEQWERYTGSWHKDT